MMVSTKGRYALRVMIDLAEQDRKEYVSLKAVSERQGISMKYLEAIVARLNKAGLLESKRGKDGGYRLAKDAHAYSIYDILKETEDKLAPVACIDGDGNVRCERSGQCRTLPLWQKLDTVIDSYLQSVSLSDVLEGRLSEKDA